ncbi:MAG: patatin-like phospholipase family protein [Nostoc sp. DedVER02]|uniref:patatin-like phospholipase family protein n=1 Tax=unclassified Nostoc TaxID=2593658 RepID=UPI002AD20DC6|nr:MULTISPECIES: patatin-like phospholipase family protein [unclassified Nostoc]MDZ7985399.1 patatin-like phospholipase family protein [Nostoc sp. DedVER02]MDZ8116865.1 patatin-like phospholipase family protein [Nostoc sp. DedVER01b]
MSSQNQDKKKFRILALDGGGIRGVVTAKILEKLQKQLKQPLNKYFDLITGTSTGSIVAAGLVIGKTPEQLAGIYEKRGKEIFKSPFFRIPILSTKYSNEGLIQVLKEELGEKITLREVGQLPGAELLVLAYDTLYRNTTLFASRHFEKHNGCWFNDKLLWEICVSSASAPTFFPPYEFTWEDEKGQWTFPHVDGGIGANCPSLAAIRYAMSEKEQSIQDISILSIGTGRTTRPLEYKEIKNWNLLNWAKNIPDVFMGGQIQINTESCQDILNAVNPGSYCRLQFNITEPFEKKGSEIEPARIIKPKERKNKFTKEHINDAMDDASEENIRKLLDAASEYADSKHSEIENFINYQESTNLQPITV